MIRPDIANVFPSHVDIKIRCRGGCEKVQRIRVPRSEYHAYYEEGKLAQEALKSLGPVEREMLISGTCGKCWNEIFKGGAVVRRWYRKFVGKYHGASDDWVSSGLAVCGAKIENPSFVAAGEKDVPKKMICKRCVRELMKRNAPALGRS